MSSLLLLLPTSKFGYGGAQPLSFTLGSNSTLDFQSSINNKPAFTSYQDPYLKTLTPTKLSLGGITPVQYFQNLPK